MYKILIVDDEKMIREGIKKVIDWEALDIHEVLLASSGREAFEIIQQENPDILLTDISMAHMTGLELIEKTLNLLPTLKVLVLTGFDSFEYARKALRLKVQDFLLKPVDEDILTEAIRKQVILLQEENRQKEAEKEQRRITGLKEQVLFEKNLRDLLHKRNIESSRTYFEENYESFCKANMSVAVLKLPLGAENEKDSAIVVCRQILSLSVSLIDSKELGVTIWDDDGKTLIVIIYVECCGSDGVDIIRDLCSIIHNETGQLPRTAIGNMVNGYRSLDKSYYEAVCLLENEQ
ncbi:MAG: response regulator, partial [Clostridium sp.]|nr:response regulator [Clostridium sp.]